MTWTKFNSFPEDLAEGVIDMDGHTFMVALSNTAPNAANSQLSDITQIAGTGGYAPAAMTISTSSSSGGTYTAGYSAVTFTASGADFAPFRYLVVYDDTAASDKLVAWEDYGDSYTLPDGQTFTLSAGTLFTLA